MAVCDDIIRCPVELISSPFFVKQIEVHNDNVMALQVTTMTANETSHITIATRDGHKPVESNEIKNWYGLYCAEEFEGYLELCD